MTKQEGNYVTTLISACHTCQQFRCWTHTKIIYYIICSSNMSWAAFLNVVPYTNKKSKWASSCSLPASLNGPFQDVNLMQISACKSWQKKENLALPWESPAAGHSYSTPVIVDLPLNSSSGLLSGENYTSANTLNWDADLMRSQLTLTQTPSEYRSLNPQVYFWTNI